jgi:hypothetical protein
MLVHVHFSLHCGAPPTATLAVGPPLGGGGGGGRPPPPAGGRAPPPPPRRHGSHSLPPVHGPTPE